MVLKEQKELVKISEYQELAQQSLSEMAYGYYVGGANDEITVNNNHLAYERILLSPKVLVDVSKRNLSTSILGTEISMPILVAPTAFQAMACDEGEIATAKACAKANTIMILSTLANFSIEEVMQKATGPVWFQLYVYKDRAITKSLIERADEAGCKAIVLTVDSPLLGRRERDIKNCFQLPKHLSAKNLIQAGMHELPNQNNNSGLAAYIDSLYDASLSWKDIEWLRSITKLPILIKGIMRADDAQRAIDYGASGIIVSNHGGRQLDTVPATIDVLPKISAVVDNKIEILIDGGIRRGTDVIKALALGAKAVLIGRPILWGLAADGADGAYQVLELLQKELDHSLALLGCPNISDISRDLLA
jgi:4-hydroxymandelate oxidase